MLVLKGETDLFDDLFHCFLIDLQFFKKLLINFRVFFIVFKFGHSVFLAVLKVDDEEEGAFN